VQDRTPFLEALKQQSKHCHAPFYLPGHKQGKGVSQPFKTWLGNAVFEADLPELPELDNLFNPEGVIRDAQRLAAEAFGASQTWFLANGSTAGVVAAILATCLIGDKILLPRNVHKSAISGLILSGAKPVFINPEYHTHWNIALSVDLEALEAALSQHPDIKVIFLVSPTYHGVCSDLETIADRCHDRNVILIVDEAHGAHFKFHPDFPKSALECGADLVVQSTHKTLSALSQASMLHVKGDRIDRTQIDRALSLVQSTSPNALLLASLDAARYQMATEGFERLQQTLDNAESARSKLSQLPNLKLFEQFENFDRTRITIDATKWGLTGYEADEILHEQFGVTCELPELQHLTFAVTLGNTVADIDRLVEGFEQLQNLQQITRSIPNVSLPPIPSAPMTPRDAYFTASEAVAIEGSLDRICTELLCPYPPGIPILIPGERITSAALAYLQNILNAGGLVTGFAETTGKTVRVAKAKSRSIV